EVVVACEHYFQLVRLEKLTHGGRFTRTRREARRDLLACEPVSVLRRAGIVEFLGKRIHLASIVWVEPDRHVDDVCGLLPFHIRARRYVRGSIVRNALTRER